MSHNRDTVRPGGGSGKSAWSARGGRPVWPYPHIVRMTAHQAGYWCKKIRQRVYYFGPLDDPLAALEAYQRDGPDLHAGRVPARRLRGGWANEVSVRDVANAFLRSRSDQVDAGKITAATWRDYWDLVRVIVESLGRHRRVCDLRTPDFESLHNLATTRFAPSGVAKLVKLTRLMFRWAHQARLLDEPVEFGGEFGVPSLAADRRRRRRGRRAHFHRDEILALLERTRLTGSHALRAMIMLGINAGFGQHDCASLPRDDLSLAEGVIRQDRPKTGIERVAPLWPETVDAISLSLDHRPQPADGVPRDLGGPVFLTRSGNLFVRQKLHRDRHSAIVRVTPIDAVSMQLRRHRAWLGLLSHSPAFYGLRHTFRTIADRCPDQHAVHRVMGHRLPGMSDTYVDEISLDRCRAVTDHVRAWLFGGLPADARWSSAGWCSPWPRSQS